ncbi:MULTISPECIES: hypothetical protein [unclassified Haematobacter]|uniref:hypothetical protein n=1 Tax=unclassified Haematobacter TaxID=2640585 RepID=UPI0025BC6B48|nr:MULTISPECIES: hypothetical protein [unclassified Haematobacter]
MIGLRPLAGFAALVGPFVIWSIAFVLLYGTHATGCALGWEGRVFLTTSLLRAVLAGILALTFAALFLLRPAGGEEPLARVARLMFIAALVATVFCFWAVFVLPLC